jgi:hypothetical protein
MEMCRLMQMVILTLKICARKIVQQNDNNLEGDDNFFGWRSQRQVIGN